MHQLIQSRRSIIFEPQETALTETRFELACARCSAVGSGNPEGVEVQHEDDIPICQDIPTGARAMLSGTTVEDIFLEAGYYRTSAESRKILECHRSKACVGGDDATDYCAIGYKGPCKCYRPSCLHSPGPAAGTHGNLQCLQNMRLTYGTRVRC